MSRRDLASRYWEAYESSLAPPPGSAARNLAAVQRRIRAGEEVELASRSVATPRRAAAGVLWWGKAVAASVGLGVTAVLSVKLTVMGWAVLTHETPAPPPSVEERASSSSAPRSAPVAASEAPAPSSPAIAEPSTSGPASASSPRPRPPAPRAELPASTTDALRAELALMDRARAALERDDVLALWQLASEHERRFPAGALREERQAWLVVAACALGRSDAPQRAARFLREHAGSAQAPRVRQTCVPTRTIE
ncbi:MAG: hypothetical protein H6712_15645 [Myxococcales bacterium]|nr:hypothetical protein [Myxococcales bacterium]